MLAELGATNSLWSLFLSYPTFTVPFCTWLLIGFFKALPDELEEAALVDGAGRVHGARARAAAAGRPRPRRLGHLRLHAVVERVPLRARSSSRTRQSITVPVGLNLLIYGDVFHWGQLMAASVITTVPVVALYMFIHRWMVEGLAAGSVKG